MKENEFDKLKETNQTVGRRRGRTTVTTVMDLDGSTKTSNLVVHGAIKTNRLA